MFTRKYNAIILSSKWDVIKKKQKLITVPVKGDYIYMDFDYYLVTMVIHNLTIGHGLSVIVEKVDENDKVIVDIE